MRTRIKGKLQMRWAPVLAAVFVLLLCGAGLASNSIWHCRIETQTGQVIVSGDPTLSLLPGGPDLTQAPGPFPVPAWAMRYPGFGTWSVTEKDADRSNAVMSPGMTRICWFDTDGSVSRVVGLGDEAWAEVSRDGTKILKRDVPTEHADGTRFVELSCESAEGELLFSMTVPMGHAEFAPSGDVFAWRRQSARGTELWSCDGKRIAVVPGIPDNSAYDYSSFSGSGERMATITTPRARSGIDTLYVVSTSTGCRLAAIDLGRVNRARLCWHDEQLFVFFTRWRASHTEPYPPAELVRVDPAGTFVRTVLTEIGPAHRVDLCASMDGERLFVAVHPQYAGALQWSVHGVSAADLTILAPVDIGEAGADVLGLAAGPGNALAVLMRRPGEETSRLLILEDGETVSSVPGFPPLTRWLSTTPDGSVLLLAGLDQFYNWGWLYAVRWH